MSLGPELSKDNSADVVTVDGEEEVAHARNLLFASLILRHLLPVCRDWRQGENQVFTMTWPLAETEGFEPSVRVNPVRRFSKPLVSATHPRLRRLAARRGL